MKPPPPAARWPLTNGADYDELTVWLAYREARALLNPLGSFSKT